MEKKLFETDKGIPSIWGISKHGMLIAPTRDRSLTENQKKFTNGCIPEL